MGSPPSPSVEPEAEALSTASDGALPEPPSRRQLHPLPPGLVELYGLLAVLFVLVPEWMAGGALLGLRLGREDPDLPVASAAWQKLPELRLATLSLAELRQLAQREGLWGYGRWDRAHLTRRLLQRLRPAGGKQKSMW
jgi:hypothetical protein